MNELRPHPGLRARKSSRAALASLPLVLAFALAALLRCTHAAARSSADDGDRVATGLDADERVELYPTAAALSPDGATWSIPLHACVFEPEAGDPLRAIAIAPLRALIGAIDDAADARRFEQRARLFLVDHERHETVQARLGERSVAIGPTEANGHATTALLLPAGEAAALARDGRFVDVAVGAPGDPARAETAVELVGPLGLSVISDLDDTVKVTHVRDAKEALRATFLREFEAVPGMAELYARLGQRGASFHYVSLSPWQLAAPLREFLARSGFPRGSLHLQHFRLQDGDFADVVGDSQQKKIAAIEPLLAAWPQRRFLLVGDSGQRDPETYGELARRHPGQIAAIWIRLVDRPADPAATEAELKRLCDAFAGVAPERWLAFEKPQSVRLPE